MTLRDKLFRWRDPYDLAGTEDLFAAAMAENAALQAAGCTGDMSAEEICEAIVAVMPTISVDGLTGQGMTWAATGEVSKAPMAVVIKDGVYVTP